MLTLLSVFATDRLSLIYLMYQPLLVQIIQRYQTDLRP